MNWYYAEKGKQTGPVNDAQLGNLLRKGSISRETLIWRDGLPGWVPYREIFGGTPSPDPSTPIDPPSGPEAVCSRCGKMFPLAHTARHGEDRLCLDCKAIVSKKNRPAGPLSAENLDYAPILLRFAAAFLDGLVMGAFNIALLYLSGTMIRARNNASTLPTIEIVLCGVAMLIAASYEGIMVGTYGATFGKMACRIKVVTSNGGHVSHARAFGRFFAKQLSVLPCLLGFIIAIFDNPRNRTLHDRLCNTRVVRR